MLQLTVRPKITANGSLLAAVVAALAFRQLKCREKDEKRGDAE